MIRTLTSGVLGLRGGIEFDDVSRPQAEVKEMARYACFGDFFASFKNPGEFNFKSVVVFRKYVKIFDFSGLTFQTVALHDFPLLRLSEN